MGAGLLAVKRGFLLFIKDHQFFYTINTLEREMSIILCPLTVTPLTRFPKECFLLDCPGLGLS